MNKPRSDRDRSGVCFFYAVISGILGLMVEITQSQENRLSPEEEIRELERRLEEKKRLLTESGKEIPHEKEVFREVLKEHIESVKPSAKDGEFGITPVAGVAPGLPTDLQSRADDLKKKEEREEHVRELIEIAMTHSIESAVKVAQEATPYLLDELHDHLVDDFYEKLVALRKIKEL